ncbi:GNAT family N-acetyltransferase [Xylanibacter muris]|uniref:GNAT family N-acetyltransferase n=1 Tax=Xylanibacter muris TaxID=2736290 RepID=A0ABX2AMP7_9BACT|nr:GNAT family N-acetyltransferase [Xylanibacter muris]NPD91527.1 GNAT family N-acetyltransferase [Xylanibacter muris]
MKTISFRNGQIEDAQQIAQVIITAMTEECCKHFYGENHSLEEFHSLMVRLVSRTDTQYSYKNTICAIDADKNIAGAIVSYDGGKLLELRRVFTDSIKEVFGRDFSNMEEETQAGELYLDSLAVFPEYRGQGIAKELLKRAHAKAKETGIGISGLLVDCNNPNAERLYRSVGFIQVGEKIWGGHKMKHLQMQ